MPGGSIVDLIDELLKAPKSLGGEPVWQNVSYNLQRLVMPLLVGGVSTNAELQVHGFPVSGHAWYRILICAPKCVWRIDHVHDERHVNSFNRPSDLAEYDFTCPHYHAWSDNRRFCTPATLPDRLENARILPAGLRSFDSVFRWFCAETNIEQQPNGLIALPPRIKLL